MGTMAERARALWELNAKEQEVAHLVALGHTNPEIGDMMYLSTQTVKWYVRRLFEKMGVSNRVQLARKWIVEVER